MVSINEFKGWLNSTELATYEFLCSIREVNSWEDLGELLVDAYNQRIDLELGDHRYMLLYELSQYAYGLNGLVFKYMVSLENQVFNFGVRSEYKLTMYITKPNGSTRGTQIKCVGSCVDLLKDCQVMECDRGLGIFDVKLAQVPLEFKGLDLEFVYVIQFFYDGKVNYDNGWFYNSSGNKSWQQYNFTWKASNKKTVRVSRVGDEGDELPF